MSSQEQIESILSMNLPKEVKEKLLIEIAKGIEDSKTEEKTFETKRQELIEKNKKHVEEVKQNIEKRNYDYDVNYKTEILSRIKNQKKDYYLHKKSDLEQLTGTEILAIYDMYKQNNPEMLEEAKTLYEQDREKQKNNIEEETDNKEETKEEAKEPEDIYSSIKVSNPSKMPEKDIEKVKENIIKAQDNIGASLKVTEEPSTSKIKKVVSKITEAKPKLKEKIKNKLAELKEKRQEQLPQPENKPLEEQTDRDLLEKIHNEAGFQTPQEDLSSKEDQNFIPEEFNQNETQPSIPAETPSITEPESQSLETKTDADLLNDIVANSGLKGVQETPDLTADEIYKVAGFNDPKTR